jgi:intracellular multiplication protein IcmK
MIIKVFKKRLNSMFITSKFNIMSLKRVGKCSLLSVIFLSLTVYAAPGSQASAVNELQSGADTIDQLAFNQVLKSKVPFTNNQIMTLHQRFDSARRAVATLPGKFPRPTSKTDLVNLAPGATPPVIRLESGFVTTLIFLDSTGQPWPIQAYDNGNPKAFNINWDQKSNPGALLVQSTGDYSPANLVVMLKGMHTPVVLTLLTGQAAVDYRVDLRIPARGPNASVMYAGLPNEATPQLLDVLDGAPPAGSKRLTVEGGKAEAWMIGGRLFLRSTSTLISPSWTATMSSSDGTHAYELVPAPVLLVSRQGQVAQLTIKGL